MATKTQKRTWLVLLVVIIHQVWPLTMVQDPPKPAKTKKGDLRVKRVARGQRPTIAIIGRPNVGKSTLVNRMCDAGNVRGAIVYDEPGVTRDRVYQTAEWGGRQFDVVDTGGLLFDDRDGMFVDEIREQAVIALRESCAAVLVVDGREGRVQCRNQV